jgi:hypothetical protein
MWRQADYLIISTGPLALLPAKIKSFLRISCSCNKLRYLEAYLGHGPMLFTLGRLSATINHNNLDTRK